MLVILSPAQLGFLLLIGLLWAIASEFLGWVKSFLPQKPTEQQRIDKWRQKRGLNAIPRYHRND